VGVVLEVVVEGVPPAEAEAAAAALLLAAPEKAGGGAPGTSGVDAFGDCEFAIAPVLVPSKNS